MSKRKKKEEEGPGTPHAGGATAPSEAMVTVVRIGTAEKLNPSRSGGPVTYQVGRLAGEAYLRLLANAGGGRFSREWVSLARIRACFPSNAPKGLPFKARLLDRAFDGRSSTNSGFLTAVLRAEGLAQEDPEHKGMSLLCGDMEGWRAATLDGDPVREEDGSEKTEPLRPPVRDVKLNFAGRRPSRKRTAEVETPEESGDTAEGENPEREDDLP